MWWQAVTSPEERSRGPHSVCIWEGGPAFCGPRAQMCTAGPDPRLGGKPHPKAGLCPWPWITSSCQTSVGKNNVLKGDTPYLCT